MRNRPRILIKSMTVVEASSFPSFSRRGGCASIRRSRSSAAQTGWLVKGRVASLYARTALHIFCLKLLTIPSAPLRNGIFLLMAQPPLLENGGEWTRLATNPFPFQRPLKPGMLLYFVRVATCGAVLITNQFSILSRGLQRSRPEFKTC